MKAVFKNLSHLLNIPEKEISNIYIDYWKFVKAKLEELPLKEDLTEDKFKEYRTSINIPNLGKFYCTYKDYYNIKKSYKEKNNAKYKEDKANG